MLFRNTINVPEFETWKKNFVCSKRYSQVYDLFHTNLNKEQNRRKNECSINPRDRRFGKKDINDNLYTIFWYEWILNQLNFDDLVFDIGCGNNLFKPLYLNHNLVGIDKGKFLCDIQAHLKDLDEYKGKLRSAFCFNSIHFANDEGFKSNLDYLSGLLQPKCLAVVTVNNHRLNSHRDKSIELKVDSVNRLYDTIWLSEMYDLVYFESLMEYTNVKNDLVGDIHLVIRSK